MIRANLALLCMLSAVGIIAGCGMVRNSPPTMPPPFPKNKIERTPSANNSSGKFSSFSLQQRLTNLQDTFYNNPVIPSSAALFGEEFSTDNWPQYNIAEPLLRDCIGVYNSYTSGGDLLSSLSADDMFRTALPLTVLTKSYAEDLKKAVNDFTINKYQKNLFAHHVCHLGKGIDIIAGYVWPLTNSPYSIDEDRNSIEINEKFFEQSVVLLINGKNVYELAGVQGYGNTATGGESSPCEARLQKDKTILWKCFAGLGMDEKTHITYGTYANWLISLDGTVLKQWKTDTRLP